jgi:hypothetical protein
VLDCPEGKSHHELAEAGLGYFLEQDLMKIVLVITLLAIAFTAEGPMVVAQTAKESEALREQIKADLAKAKADEENGPKNRFWDRDVDGKRPWERPLPKE